MAATRAEVATLAVYLLGGGTRAVDTEDIAVRCHGLAPEMFSWRKYPEQINLELVRVSLSDAKKPKSGALLAGAGREGWRLTSKGLAWVGARGSEILDKGVVRIPAGERRVGSVDTVRAKREYERVIGSRAWVSWRRSGYIGLRHAQEFFRADGYTTREMLDRKLARLLSTFEKDKELRRFIDAAGRVIQTQGRLK